MTVERYSDQYIAERREHYFQLAKSDPNGPYWVAHDALELYEVNIAYPVLCSFAPIVRQDSGVFDPQELHRHKAFYELAVKFGALPEAVQLCADHVGEHSSALKIISKFFTTHGRGL